MSATTKAVPPGPAQAEEPPPANGGLAFIGPVFEYRKPSVSRFEVLIVEEGGASLMPYDTAAGAEFAARNRARLLGRPGHVGIDREAEWETLISMTAASLEHPPLPRGEARETTPYILKRPADTRHLRDSGLDPTEILTHLLVPDPGASDEARSATLRRFLAEASRMGYHVTGGPCGPKPLDPAAKRQVGGLWVKPWEHVVRLVSDANGTLVEAWVRPGLYECGVSVLIPAVFAGPRIWIASKLMQPLNVNERSLGTVRAGRRSTFDFVPGLPEARPRELLPAGPAVASFYRTPHSNGWVMVGEADDAPALRPPARHHSARSAEGK